MRATSVYLVVHLSCPVLSCGRATVLEFQEKHMSWIIKIQVLLLLLATASSAANVKRWPAKAGYYNQTTNKTCDDPKASDSSTYPTSTYPTTTYPTTTYPTTTYPTTTYPTTTYPTTTYPTTTYPTTTYPTTTYPTTTYPTTTYPNTYPTTTYPTSYSTTTQSWDTTTTSGAACPLGWIDDGNLGCFLFAPQMAGLSWIEALEYCEEQVHILDVNFE